MKVLQLEEVEEVELSGEKKIVREFCKVLKKISWRNLDDIVWKKTSHNFCG